MTPDPGQQLLQALDALEWRASVSHGALHKLEDWLARTTAALGPGPLRWAGLDGTHALAMAAEEIHLWLQQALPAWQRSQVDSTQALAETLEQSALFLVFGKFNAGKSSLCNFLAERFAAMGQPIEYFSLLDGQLVTLPATRFQEGATETTTTLQGVRLGRKLVLLDTPGLHSSTPENAALTRRFTDSADGVLWLTSSSSPGQVQELDELVRELHRSKPLLPVLTRSDLVEEDEVDGDIVKVLCNKTPTNRALQEADVQQRGREKLSLLGADPALLRPPVSLSTHAARSLGLTPAALDAAGFHRLWNALQELVKPALAYKQRKSAEIVLHHLEETVLHSLDTSLMPALATLQQAMATERAALVPKQGQLVKQVWRGVMPALAPLLESHAQSGDVKAVLREFDDLLADAFGRAARGVLTGYEAASAPMARHIELPEDIGYDQHGDLGFSGSDMLIGYERLHASLEQAAHAALEYCAQYAVKQCIDGIDALDASIAALQAVLAQQRSALAGIKERLRSVGEDSGG